MKYVLLLALLLGCDGDIGVNGFIPMIDGNCGSDGGSDDADQSGDGGILGRGDGGGAVEGGQCGDGASDGGTADVEPTTDGGTADVLTADVGDDVAPRTGCDYLAQTGCAAGEACDPSCAYRPTVCRAAGTLTHGQACIKTMPYGSNCAAGHMCVSNNGGATNFCRKLCVSSDMCPSGSTCATTIGCVGAPSIGHACTY